ncbi:hypothetical protein [Palleronia sp.]|uniref:hypothetical protein n=1 Tax=Palleronia sp. TaxID=1940284 RepID=UPI0035C85638
MPDDAAGWVSRRGLAFAVVLSLLSLWPMAATGTLLIFPDTASYFEGGAAAWDMARDLLGIGDAAGTTVGTGNGQFARSFVYSTYVYAVAQLGGPVAVAFGHTLLTMLMLMAVLPPPDRLRSGVLGAGLATVLALSSLPWYASYLMPDILAAAVVLYGAVLAMRFDTLRRGQRLLLGTLAAIAIATHYGYPPLAVALYGGVLIWRGLTRRLTLAVVFAAILPVVSPLFVNLEASGTTLDEPSVAPLRLPILLARSIEDGPARWYLNETCPTLADSQNYALCDAFPNGMPNNISSFLWDEDGIKKLTPQQLERVRDEEAEILIRAFQAYPLAQTWSLIGNAALQTVRVGVDDLSPAASITGGPEELSPMARSRARTVLNAADAVLPWTALLGLAVLAGLAYYRRLDRHLTLVTLVVLAGLLVNAAIFGGLSAPVDRYQSRIAWLLPMLAAVALATRSRPHRVKAASEVRTTRSGQ